MQIARPPATPEVADPGGGRSLVLMQGTNLSLDLNFAALRAVLNPYIKEVSETLRVGMWQIDSSDNYVQWSSVEQ
jgi:hypothetical protein